MTLSYGFVVCARIPTPRNLHAYTYLPISAVSFDLGAVQRCWEGLVDPKRRKPPIHPQVEETDGYVLCELRAVSLEKPRWIERDLLDNPPAPRRINERLADIIDLDQEKAYA